MQLVDKKVKMDLVGEDGNAFAIMGRFKRAARRDNWTDEEVKTVLDACTSGDYNNLLTTILDHTEVEEEDGV